MEGLVHQLAQRRIELLARLGFDLRERLIEGDRLSVGPDRGHRVDDVGNGEDSCRRGYVVPGKAVGVTTAGPALMVVTHDLADDVRKTQRSDDAFSEDRVGFEYPSLRVGERAGLVEYGVGDPDLAYVVKQERRLQ